MRQYATKTDYFVKVILTVLVGAAMWYSLPSFWRSIHSESLKAETIDAVEQLNVSLITNTQHGIIHNDLIQFQFVFSDGSKFNRRFQYRTRTNIQGKDTVIMSGLHNMQEMMNSLHRLAMVDSNNWLQRLPITKSKDELANSGEPAILAIQENGKWELLKIGDEYLAGSKMSLFSQILLYAVCLVFIILGGGLIFAGVYIVYTDTRGFKTFDKLTYMPGRYDGLIFVLRGFKHEEEEKEEDNGKNEERTEK